MYRLNGWIGASIISFFLPHMNYDFQYVQLKRINITCYLLFITCGAVAHTSVVNAPGFAGQDIDEPFSESPSADTVNQEVEGVVL